MVKPGHGWWHAGLVGAVMLATASCVGGHPMVVETPTPRPAAGNTIWAWPDNSAGQLGDGSFNHQKCVRDGRYYDCTPVPVQVSLTDAIAISSGSGTGYALKADGTVWAWGSNFYGDLGDGNRQHSNCVGDRAPDFDCSPTPVQVAGLSGVAAISSGPDTAYALKADGTVWAWGYNNAGELGDGSDTHQCPLPPRLPSDRADGTDCSLVPVQVTISDVSAIATGFTTELIGVTYALKQDGTVWRWGGHSDNPEVAQVDGLKRIAAINSGGKTGYFLQRPEV